jgi:ribosomal protein L36
MRNSKGKLCTYVVRDGGRVSVICEPDHRQPYEMDLTTDSDMKRRA